MSATNAINPMNDAVGMSSKPNREMSLSCGNELVSSGDRSFLPLLETFQYSHAKVLQKIKPLFSNYLFAKLDIDAHYYKVKWTRGVNKILGGGVEPVPISEKVIQTIKDRMGENNLVKLDEGLEEGPSFSSHQVLLKT